MKPKTGLFLVVFLLLFDRFFKVLSLKSEGGFFIIPKTLKFTFFPNQHLAFSLPAPQNFTIVLSIIIILMLSLYLFQSLKFGRRGLALALLAIVLGALSNLLDRLTHGFVIDYLHLWPISYFNLADLMIGTGILYLVLFFKSPQNYKFQAPNPK